MKDPLTCPRGHSIHPSQLLSVVDLKVKNIDKAVIFTCQCGEPKQWHDFTLARAVKFKMFTPEEAAILRSKAEDHRKKHGYKE